jgi:hypothetical protein
VGIEGPTLIATCEFERGTPGVPNPSDFGIEVVDASDLDLHQVAGVRVVVGDIRPIAR